MSVQEQKLAAIADAIREKEGSTEPIPAGDFPMRILALETGGLPDGIRTITVTSSDPEKGTVSGGGMASDGMKVIVTAQGAEGYELEEWQEDQVAVSDNSEYAFTVTKDRALIAKFMVQMDPLPDGAKRVEYVSIDVSACVDTGILPVPSTLRIEMDMLIEQALTSASKSRYLFYAKYYDIVSGGTTYRYNCCAMQSNANKYFFYVRGGASGPVFESVGVGERFTLDYDGVEGTVLFNGSSQTVSPSSYKMTSNLFLGGNTSLTNIFSCKMKLYSAKVYVNRILQRDFQPCVKADGTAVLYDNITKQFFGSASSSPLVAGPLIE